MKIISMTLAAVALSACSGLYISHAPITANERHVLENPPAGLVEQIEAGVPELATYNREIEAVALKHGRPLNAFEREDAIKVGVRDPDKVRILVSEDFPGGNNATLFSEVGAITAGHGILVKPKLTYVRGAYREVIAHELAHVRQFEELGFDGMARRALLEYSVLDNKLVPLEREAIAIGEAVYDDPNISYGF